MQQSVTLLDLIPQRPPMVLVDRFHGIGPDQSSRTTLRVTSQTPFCDGDTLTECGLIEHMAQSAAARVGWLCRESGQPVPIGYIGSVSHFQADRLPLVGETVETDIRVIQEVFDISLVAATSRIGDQTVARCELKIFLSHATR